MPDKKLTDNEIVNETNEIIHELSSLNRQYTGADAVRFSIGFFRKILKNLRFLLDLINRLQEKNSNLTSDLTSLRTDLSSLKTDLTSAKAENERLTIRLRKAEHQLDDLCKMHNIIKAEAYKEFAERLQKKLDPTLIAITRIGCVLVDVSKSHISEKDALQKIRDYLNGLEIETRLSFDMAVCDILKELVGEDNESQTK